MWKVSDLPKWLASFVAQDAMDPCKQGVVTHVRFDTAPSRFSVPAGIACYSKDSYVQLSSYDEHTWDDYRFTMLWAVDRFSNELRNFYAVPDGLFSSTGSDRHRRIASELMAKHSTSRSKVVMVTYFRCIDQKKLDKRSRRPREPEPGEYSDSEGEDETRKEEKPDAEEEGNSVEDSKEGIYSIDNLFSDDGDFDGSVDAWSAFSAITGDDDVTQRWMSGVDTITEVLRKRKPIPICSHCGCCMHTEMGRDLRFCPDLSVESYELASAGSSKGESGGSPEAVPDGQPKRRKGRVDSASSGPAVPVGDEEAQDASVDGPPKVTPKFPPSRLLPAVSEAVDHLDHGLQMDPHCPICQEYAMRDRSHRAVPEESARAALRIGGVAVDLAERPSTKNLVQTVLVASTIERRKGVRKIIVAVPMKGKAKSDVRKALMQALLRIEHIYGGSPISRVHGDKEGAVRALQEDLNELGMLVTTTVGNDAKGNPFAENAILQLTRLARMSLGQALRALPNEERSRAANELWGHAMAHSADWISCDQFESYGENDPDDLRPPMIRKQDMIPFLSEALCKQGAKLKADRVEPTAFRAHYLGPHHLTSQGTKLMMLSDTYPPIVDSSVVRPVLDAEGKAKFPLSYPVARTERPPLGKSNEVFSWAQCCRCQKFRCVPVELHSCLKEWNIDFQCQLTVDHEGIAGSCDDPEDDDAVPDGQRIRGAKGTRRHAGQAPRKPGRKLGVGDTKPRKLYNDGKPRKKRENAEANVGIFDHATDEVIRAVHEAMEAEAHLPFPSPTSYADEEDPAGRPDVETLKAEWKSLSEYQKADAHVNSSAAYARMLKALGIKPDQVQCQNTVAFHALLDWFSSEESIRQDEEQERQDEKWEDQQPVDLGAVEWEIYQHKPKSASANASQTVPNGPATEPGDSSSHRSSFREDFRSALHAASTHRSAWSYACENQWTQGERLIPYLRAHMYVYQPLKLKDAASRKDYAETVAKEVGRMMEFCCWGRPVARSSIPDGSWVYRVNLLYGIKNAEMPVGQGQKDKARLVLMGNLRFTKAGRLLLDRWFRTPGEFWAPASSMAGLRFVAALAVILGLPLETIDLDSAYLQTVVRQTGDYLQLTPEVIKHMPDDWKMAVEREIQKDLDAGGTGEVVFPLYKNMYGKAPSGQNFIQDLQSTLEARGWVRVPHCPGTFLKFCPKTKKPMLIANYVDDFAAVMTNESRQHEWDELRKLWKFDPPRRSERFLGIEMHYPTSSLRYLILHQSEYADLLIQRYEKDAGYTIRERVNLPTEEPIWPEEGFQCESGTIMRSAIGAIAYAARGTRLDLMKAFHSLSRRVTRWTPEARAFLEAVLGYLKHTRNTGLVLDARGLTEDLTKWIVDTSVDSSFGPPWCQSGFVVSLTLANRPSDPLDERFLAVDWVTNGQEYAKLSPGEAETVGLVQGARGGLKYKFSWDILRGQEETAAMTVRIDNTQAKLFVERGWSPEMMHIPRIYGVNVLWITERLREGIFDVLYENTKHMLADPLTKLLAKPTVYMERKVLTRFLPPAKAKL